MTSSQIAFPWVWVGSQVCVKFWQDSEPKTYLPITTLYNNCAPLGPAGLRRPQSSCFAKFFNLSLFWRVTGWRYCITGVLILVRHAHLKENMCNNMSIAFKTSLLQELNFYDFIKIYYFMLASKLSKSVGQNLF